MVYMLAFCRVVIGLVFAISSFSKGRDFAQFHQAILGFRLLSRQLSNFAAPLFLCGEFVVALFMLIGGPLLLPGFALAIVLLFIFCAALASVLLRKLHTQCHCFGSSSRPVTPVDIWRNVGFLLCAGGGCEALIWTRGMSEGPAWIGWLFICLGAGAFVIIWIQLGEIVQLFRQG
ncbi:MAG TPA: MauE/DoxX family redox-associated membrane protein [Ktedonobacterales bacterium]|nr:MauE/DoxX family redox-associated membrane protein [Ktedonobacterales bacterium]